MKKIILILFAILSLQHAFAQNFNVGGINYNVTSPTTVEVAINAVRDSRGFITGEPSGAITIPAQVNYSGVVYSVTSIGTSAFASCKLTSVVIPNTVVSIGNDAFNGCDTLPSITIPNSVTSIGDRAFYYLPLTTVNMSSAVISIGIRAFYQCGLLTSITLPNTITSIGDYAFQTCTSLTSVTCNATIPPSINATVFENVNQGACTLKVPASSINAYLDVAFWSNFSPITCSPTDNTTSVSASCSYTWANNNQTYSTTGVYTGVTANCVTEKLNLTITAAPTSFTSESLNYVVTSATTVAVGINSGKSGSIVIPASVTTACGTYSVTTISASAFQACSGLTEVTIPTSVTSIGNQAFLGCTSLSSVIIPNSVTNVGLRAFRDCTGLTSVTISNALTSTSQGTFYNCTNLESINIPSSLTSIGPFTFYGCSGLKSVTIPSSVTSIGNSAFDRCSSLTSITIPSSVTSISSFTFYRCSALQSVTIPNSVTSISNSAFDSCSSLTSITIPGSVSIIGEFAFYNCYNLTSVFCDIEIPLSINSNVFSFVNQGNCSLTVPNASIAAYQAAVVWRNFNPIKSETFSVVGINYVVTSPTTVAVGINTSTTGNIVIPETVTKGSSTYTVTSIIENAFKNCSGLTLISIPNSVTSIGEDAFAYCSGLTTLNIPNSLTRIEAGTFEGCSGLQTFTIPNMVNFIGSSAFGFCSSLTTISIPNSVNIIAPGAFGFCTSLTSVTIPNSLTILAYGTFYNCSSLTSIVCNLETPLSITADPSDPYAIAYGVFGGSVNQAACTLTVPAASIAAYQAAPIWKDFSPIACPNSTINTTDVTACGNYTWGNNGKLYTTSGVYTGLTTDCVIQKLNLTLTTAPTTFANDGINYVITSPTTVSVGNNAGKSGSIIIPASLITTCGTYAVTSIGEFAFNGCSSLTSVTMPNSVISIDRYAFNGCSGLSSVTIPNSVTTLGVFAFGACSNLTSLTISNTLTSISLHAFNGCSSLTSVTIPNSVTSISYGGFMDCSALTSIAIPNSVTSIGDYAFYRCTSLTSVAISNSLTSIGNYSFQECSGLTSVTIPNSVASIGFAAFSLCSGLTSVTIPNSVTSIGQYAFENCSALTSLVCDVTTPLSVNSNVFQNVNQGACTLAVPAASIDAYKAAPIWQNFAPITSISTTYSTTWDYGVPTAIVNAVIAGDYTTTTGSFTAKNLTVNAGKTLTVATGTSLTVVGALVNNGSIIVENNANLIQTSGTNTNSGSGTATVIRNSYALKRLDYTMWSSPVIGTQTLLQFSPLTSAGASIRFNTYNPNTNVYNTVDPTTTFSAGTGYLIRMPNEMPGNLGLTTPYYLGNLTLPYVGVFRGTLNNGPITLTTEANKFYAIGNPYPSAISADAFFDGNATTGPFYFWRKTNGALGTAYSTYNEALGGVAGSSGIAPNGTIQVGQGFIVKATSTSLSFTNSMREITPTSTTFLKTKKVTDKSRLWLDLSDSTSRMNQVLIGYLDGATVGFDAGIDGKYINDSKIALSSIVEGEEYVIQGRPTFDATDVVALGFKTDVAGTYSITLNSFDGLFEKGQYIYLVDAVAGKEIDLKTGSYTFTAAAGQDNTRFSLKYQKTLNVDALAFDENSVKVYKNNETIFVNATSRTIKTIEVYDVQGRLIAKQMNVNDTKASITNLKEVRQMLIVKVRADDNSVVSKKVMN